MDTPQTAPVDQPIPAPAPVESPAPVAAEDTRSPIERMSRDERQQWELTGDVPESVTGKPAAPPAAAEESADPTLSRFVKTPPPPGVSRRQHERNELIRAATEAQQRADALEARLRQPAPAPEPQRPEQPAQPVAEDAEPALDDFMDQADPYVAWQRATAKWEVRQEFKARDIAAQQQAQRSQFQRQIDQTVGTYQERETAFKATVPDFDARTLAFRSILDPTDPIGKTILASEVAPQLILKLSELPDEVRRIGAIAQHDMTAALRELWKHETSLSGTPASAATPQPKTVSSAPVPGTYLGSQPAPAADATRSAVARRDFLAFDEAETSREMARATGRR